MKPIWKILIVVFFVFLGLFGGVFILIGSIVLHENDHRVETTAVISRIETGMLQSDHDVYVSYTVDGKDYETRSNVYDSRYYEGKEIKVFYDPENPEKIYGDTKLLGTIFIIIGSFVSSIAVIYIILMIVLSFISGRRRTVT